MRCSWLPNELNNRDFHRRHASWHTPVKSVEKPILLQPPHWYPFQLILTGSERSSGARTRRSPQGMVRPCQGLQCRIGAAAALLAGGSGSSRPRRCASWQGRAIPCPRALRATCLTRLARNLPDAPCAQPLPEPLNMSISTGKGTGIDVPGQHRTYTW